MNTKTTTKMPPKQKTVNVGLDRVTIAGSANRALHKLRASLALFLFRMLGVRTLTVSVPVPASGVAQNVEVSLFLGSPT